MLKSLETQSLRSIIMVAFALLFAIPLLIFFYIAVHFDLLAKPIVQVSLAGYLSFSLFGFALIRQTVDRVIALADEATTISESQSFHSLGPEHNELKKIATTFHTLVARMEENTYYLDKRIRELDSLRDITETSAKISDLKLLFGVILEKLVTATDSKAGMILSLTREGTHLKLEASLGLSEEDFGDPVPVENCLAGAVLSENRTLVSDDPTKEAGYFPRYDFILGSHPLVAKPIKARGKSIGVLVLSRGASGSTFSEFEVEYLSTVLVHTGFAFDNAQLIRDMNNTYIELKEMHQKLVEYERLAAVNQTVVTLSDSINNPLTVIRGHLDLIQQTLDIDDEKLTRSLDLIGKAVVTCEQSMKKLRDIPRPAVTPYAGEGFTMIDPSASFDTAGDDIYPSTDSPDT
jgi:hypothetical protein